MFEILKEKYSDHESIVEKLSSGVFTKHDYEQFSKLIIGIYENGYLKAVSDHRDQLEKLGFKARVISEPTLPEGEPVFIQKNQVVK